MNRGIKSLPLQAVSRGQKSKVKSGKGYKLFAALLLLFASIHGVGAEEKTAPSGKIKVAILPWKINAPEGLEYLRDAINDMLASRIGSEPPIEIIKESSIKSALSKYSSEAVTEDIAQNIGKAVNADYVVYGSIAVIADSVSIDAKAIAIKKITAPIFFASQGKGLENIVPLVNEMAKDTKAKIFNTEGITTKTAAPSESSAYTGKFVAKERPAETIKEDDFIIAEKINAKGIWKSLQFPTAMKHIEIADIDGDKKNEIVMIDSHSLFIYRLNGQKLELVKEFKGDVSVKNYSVSIADINNSGTPEIYVARMVNDRLNSYVLEYKDGEFKIIASDLKWFARVLREKAGPMLIGQKYTDTTGFFGAVQKLEWKDGRLQEALPLDIPKGLNLYNFEMADLDRNGTIDIVAFDERDYLHVYNKDNNGVWQEIWKSGEFYGGTLNRLELGTSSTNIEATDFIDIKPRIIYEDLYGDGIGEIIIGRNDPGLIGRYMKVVRSYDKSEMIDLTWEGYALEENWKTKKIEGYIADYAVADIDNDGQKELVIVIVMEGGIGKSYIMAYKMNPVRNFSR
ncbi:MAG: VCBS repeat-containing protein [Deltaproteobacteria bacterium]|nr:VCBS repeat-containing protein [Deltaproteobacteria bacterium]